MNVNHPLVFGAMIHYGSRSSTIKAVKSLFESNYPNLQLTVIDNASPEGYIESNMGERVLTLTQNCGFAGGVNIAFSEAKKIGAPILPDYE